MKIQDLHREAIEFAKKAQIEFENENFEEYESLTLKAYELEKKAAEFLKNSFNSEPTRSVLYRSAASLAFKCEKYTEAIDLITQALQGNPFEEIKTELLDILKNAVGIKSQAIKTNNYLESLRKRSVSVKLEEKSNKYAGAFVISHVAEFLKNLNQSYQNYAEAQFVKAVDKDLLTDFEYTLSKFKSQSHLLGSNTSFSSFGINISADKSVMDHLNVYTSEYTEMKSNLFSEFKEDVLYPEYEDPSFQERISEKFTDEERRKIFSPVLKSITKSKNYKISITDYEFKSELKEFKPPNNTIKNTLTPVILIPKEEEADTSLTKKIEQITGNKKKTIFTENIKYFEQELSLPHLEFEKKKIYFNDSHVILLIFEDNYYSIEDDTYRIVVSNKDYDGLLAFYSKSFIEKLDKMLLTIDILSEEEKELLFIYESTTVRDW